MRRFKNFIESWYEELNELLQELKSVPNQPTTEEDHRKMEEVVKKVVYHYLDYFIAKSIAIQRDALGIFASPWISRVEKCLQWIGGWSPTMLFHIVYTEPGIEFESEYQVYDIIRRLSFENLIDISSFPFRSRLQCETIEAEKSLTSKLSLWQKNANALTETSVGLTDMVSQLVGILRGANELRRNTLLDIMMFLTSRQTIAFMIALIELEFGIRGWGNFMDL